MLIALLSMFLPLLGVIIINALFWKLVAKILRYGGVTWPLSSRSCSAHGASMTAPTRRDGAPVGWPGALQLSVLTIALSLLFSVVLLYVLFTFTGGLRGTLS